MLKSIIKNLVDNNYYKIVKKNYFPKFWFRKIITSIFLGDNLFRRWLSTSPALENIISDGTDEAGIQAYFNAISDRGLNKEWWVFQNVIGSSNKFKYVKSKYCLINVAAVVLEKYVCDQIVATSACK